MFFSCLSFVLSPRLTLCSQGPWPFLAFVGRTGLGSELDPQKERGERLSERKRNNQTRVQGGDAPEWRSRHLLQRFVRISRSAFQEAFKFRKGRGLPGVQPEPAVTALGVWT